MFSWYAFCNEQTDRVRKEVRSYALVNLSGFYRYVFGGEARVYVRIGWLHCDPANKKLSWVTLYPVDEAGQPVGFTEDGQPIAFCSTPDYLDEPMAEPVNCNCSERR